MNLLLDTHALIWLVNNPERLGTSAATAIASPDAVVFASHVSLWEMAIKRGIGKLDEIDREAASWFEHYVLRSGLRPLTLEGADLGGLEALPLLHRDPFDRLLVVQARRRDLTVVTRDRGLARYDIDVVW